MWIQKLFILGLFIFPQCVSINPDVHPIFLVDQQLGAIHDNARLRNTKGLKELLNLTGFYRDFEMLVRGSPSLPDDEDELNYVIDMLLSDFYTVMGAHYTTEGIEAHVEIITSGLRLTEKVVMTKNDRSWTGWIAKFPQRTNNFNYIAPDTREVYWLTPSQLSSEKPMEKFNFFQTLDEQTCDNDEYMEEIILG